MRTGTAATEPELCFSVAGPPMSAVRNSHVVTLRNHRGHEVAERGRERGLQLRVDLVCGFYDKHRDSFAGVDLLRVGALAACGRVRTRVKQHSTAMQSGHVGQQVQRQRTVSSSMNN